MEVMAQLLCHAGGISRTQHSYLYKYYISQTKKTQKSVPGSPGVLPEVLKAASSAVEHWLLQRQMTLERFDSCALALR